MSTDATEINGATDARLTPPAVTSESLVGGLPDDRLFTVAEIAALFKIRKTDGYEACDHGRLGYVKFEGTVQIEGRDLSLGLMTF